MRWLTEFTASIGFHCFICMLANLTTAPLNGLTFKPLYLALDCSPDKIGSVLQRAVILVLKGGIHPGERPGCMLFVGNAAAGLL
jgi:hypothetical protein